MPRLQAGFLQAPAPPGLPYRHSAGLEPAAAGAREASESCSSGIHQNPRLPAQSVTALGGSPAKPGRQRVPLTPPPTPPRATWSDKELTSCADNGPHGMVDVGARPVGCGSKGTKSRSRGELAAWQAKLAPGLGPPAQPTLQRLLGDPGDSFTLRRGRKQRVSRQQAP